MSSRLSVQSEKITSSTRTVVIVAAVAEVVLKVVSLGVLARTPRERLRMGARWPWALVIVLVNTFGSVGFLVAGRKRAPVDDPTSRDDQPSH